MSEMSSLIIYQKHYDLMIYSFPIVNRFPKDQRFVLGQQIQNQMLEIGKMIVHANKLKQKRGKLYELDIELEKLRLLIRVAKDLGMMSIKKYGIHCERTDEIGKLLGGWIKSVDPVSTGKQGHGSMKGAPMSSCELSLKGSLLKPVDILSASPIMSRLVRIMNESPVYRTLIILRDRFLSLQNIFRYDLWHRLRFPGWCHRQDYQGGS